MKIDPNYDPFGEQVVSWEYGQAGGRSRPINRDQLYINFCEVHEILKKYKIKHWLSHGTILGIYRDGDIIKWDDDLDFCYDFSQRYLFDKIADELRELGYWVPKSDPNKPISQHNAPYADVVFIKHGEKIEGWGFEKQKDGYWIYDYSRCGNDLRHNGKFYDNLGSIEWKNKTFNCPNFLHEYLCLMYDDNYMIPNPNKKYNNQS